MIRSYLTDSAVWARDNGSDSYGEPITPTRTTVSCRIEWEAKRISDWKGEEVLVAGSAIMLEQPTPATDKIEIEGAERVIAAVARQRAFTGQQYFEVYFQ